MSSQWVRIEQINECDILQCLALCLDTRNMACYLESENSFFEDKESVFTGEQLQKAIIQEKDIIPLIKNLKIWRTSPVFLIKNDKDNKFWRLKYIKFYRYSDSAFSVHDRYNTPIDINLLTEENIIK